MPLDYAQFRSAARPGDFVVPASANEPLRIPTAYGPNLYVVSALAGFQVAFDEPDHWFFCEQGTAFEGLGRAGNSFKTIFIRPVDGLVGSAGQTVRLTWGNARQTQTVSISRPAATVTRVSDFHLTVAEFGTGSTPLLAQDNGRLSAELSWVVGPDDGANTDVNFAWGIGNTTAEAEVNLFTASAQVTTDGQVVALSTPVAINEDKSPWLYFFHGTGGPQYSVKKVALLDGPSEIRIVAEDANSALLFANTPYRLRLTTKHLL